MGRDKNRQTTKLPFMGKPIEFYRPTEGQATALVMAGKLKGVDTVVRYFTVLEKVTVKPSDWSWMEDQLLSGKAEVRDYADLMSALFAYEWADEETKEA